MAIKDNRNLFERLFNINKHKISTAPITEKVTVPLYGEETEKARGILNSITPTKTSLLNTVNVNDLDEKNLFNIYRKMDTDSVIAGALDLFADSATKPNFKTGKVVHVESTNMNFQNEINKFLQKVVKIDKEARNIVREMLKFGKVYLDVDVVEGEWGFIPVDRPELIQTLTLGNDEVRYYATRLGVEDEEDKHKLGFVSQTDTGRYEILPPSKYISLFNKRSHSGSMILETTSPITNERQETEYRIKTGKSLLEPVISTWQTLSTLEDSLFVNRLIKSISFNIVQIDVSNTSNLERTEMINNVKNAFRSSETIDQMTQSYNSRQSPVPVNDFIYVPVQGEKGTVRVERIGGELDKLDLSDIEYYNNKKFAGLGVLKAFLGWEETTPSGLGDSPLTRLDERFSNGVMQIQQEFREGVEKIIEYYWVNSDTKRTIDNLPDYKIILGRISTQDDDANRKNLQDSLSIAQSIVSLAKNDFEEFVDNKKLFNYIFGEVLNIDVHKIDTTPLPEDVKVEIKNLAESIDKDIEYEKPVEKDKYFYTKNLRQRNKKPLTIQERKIRDLRDRNKQGIHEHYDSLESLLKDHLIYKYEENGNHTLVNDLIDIPEYKNLLTEATYKSLRKQAKQVDPERIKRSKNIIVNYTGLDENNYVTFSVTAEDPEKNKKAGRPTSYVTKVDLVDLVDILKETGKFTDAELVQRAIQGDIKNFCSCPAYLYWGNAWLGGQHDYAIEPTDIAPKRNFPLQPVCKHSIATLSVLPFWWNTILRDLKQKGIVKPKAKKQKEEAID